MEHEPTQLDIHHNLLKSKTAIFIDHLLFFIYYLLNENNQMLHKFYDHKVFPLILNHL
jgi:hypothetical protein